MIARISASRAVVVAAALVAVLFSAAPADAGSVAAAVLRTGLPNQILTPGVTNPAVTPATIRVTICVSGWTAIVRPTTSYTNRLKVVQLAQYGFTDRNPSHYEEDHLIPLELGGSTTSTKNLWPEPHHIRLADGTDVGSGTKNTLANYLKREVCAGRRSLHSAQQEIALNWVKYWHKWKNPSAALAPMAAAA